jgi:hypothetical protein
VESRSSWIWKARRVRLIIGDVALASLAIDPRLSAFEGPDSVGLDTCHVYFHSHSIPSPLLLYSSGFPPSHIEQSHHSLLVLQILPKR